MSESAESRIGFRPMTMADLTLVQSIEQTVQRYPWRPGQFADSLRSGCLGWLFLDDGQPFGYAMLLGVLDEMELLTLALAHSHQGRGLGRHCLRWLQTLAWRQGARSLFLEVATHNAPALGLYTGMGFEKIGCRRDYYRTPDGHTDDAWVMRLALSAPSAEAVPLPDEGHRHA